MGLGFGEGIILLGVPSSLHILSVCGAGVTWKPTVSGDGSKGEAWRFFPPFCLQKLKQHFVKLLTGTLWAHEDEFNKTD